MKKVLLLAAALGAAFLVNAQDSAEHDPKTKLLLGAIPEGMFVIGSPTNWKKIETEGNVFFGATFVRTHARYGIWYGLHEKILRVFPAVIVGNRWEIYGYYSWSFAEPHEVVEHEEQAVEGDVQHQGRAGIGVKRIVQLFEKEHYEVSFLPFLEFNSDLHNGHLGCVGVVLEFEYKL